MNKISMLIAIASVFSLSILRANADGPPVLEDGTITKAHIVMKMDASQIRQVEKNRILDLSDIQYALLMKHGLNMPRRYVVVTPHYSDCTCDLIYLIWNKPDTFVLPLYEFDYFKEAFPEGENSRYYQEILATWAQDALIIDTKGDMHYRGENLTKASLDDLLKSVASRGPVSSRLIFINVPPHLKTEYEEKVKSTVNSIRQAAEKHHVLAQVGG